MNNFQIRIKKYAEERDWSQFHNPKDLLLGIVEEIGEIRNLIKWEQNPEVLRKVPRDHREEFEDNIGDIYWSLALLANSNNVDIYKAIDLAIKRNTKRFP